MPSLSAALALLPLSALAAPTYQHVTASTLTRRAGQSKRGICYGDSTYTELFGGFGSQVIWAYDWGQVSNDANSELEFVPMLWSDNSDLTSAWSINAKNAIAGGATHLLSFNEPDNSAESNMTPEQAASAYMEYMQPFQGEALLGGPGITAGGLTWLAEFYGNCTECHIDFQPVHWYDYAWNLAWFSGFLNQSYAVADRPIWLTEFQGWGDEDAQIDFVKNVTPWLDATDWIGHYSYFLAANGSLVSVDASGDPSLSQLGTTYNVYYSTTIVPLDTANPS